MLDKPFLHTAILSRCYIRCHFRRPPLNFLSAQLSSRLTPYIQVVKSRIQRAEKVPGVVPKYNWTYPAFVAFLSGYLVMVVFLLHVRLVTIFREEGPIALYKGFVPKVLRLAPGGGVLLLVVEFTLGLYRKGTSFVSPSCNVHSVMTSLLSVGPAIYLGPGIYPHQSC
jgi:hypothetical protein